MSKGKQYHNEECGYQRFQIGDVIIYEPQKRLATVTRPAYYHFDVPTQPVLWHDINDTGSANVKSFTLVKSAEPPKQQEMIEI